jgi:hypothetical protein
MGHPIDKEMLMGAVLRTAIVTAVWLLVQGFIGHLLLGRKGRPYKAILVVIHIIVFLPIAAGWAYTVSGLSTVSGNHVGSWIAQIVMGLAVASLLVVGSILTAGRKIPSPRGLVLTHKIGATAALIGSLAGIVCMLSGI